MLPAPPAPTPGTAAASKKDGNPVPIVRLHTSTSRLYLRTFIYTHIHITCIVWSYLQVPSALPLASPSPAPCHALQCLKSVVLSGWNPPPASRRFVGDLLYVEVRTLDDTLLHITASPNGFYLNK